MLSAALFLTIHTIFFMLRISPGTGSFPKPLSAAEERAALQRMADGDPDARALLIEHNLRLVAHVVKKGYPSRKLFLAGCGRNEVR